MKLGFILPQIGPAASAEAIVSLAKRAEEIGYDSLWVTDRLLYPVQPQNPYPGTPDGALPEVYKNVFDPILALTFAAAHTSRVTLGTSVLVMSYRNPLLLAKSLATLDSLSGGRLQVGMGQGWSKDEHDAVGVSMRERSQRGDEVVQALKAVWGDDPVEFHGQFYQIPRSFVGPKPVQKPHPPIYLAAYTPGAMKRIRSYAVE
jgi:probable F420-dependent oxidoreductase